MEEKKIFGIFVWINDDPITGNVLNMKSVVEPRKPLIDYKVGDRVLAKCPGFGIQTGVIGKISGNFYLNLSYFHDLPFYKIFYIDLHVLS